MSANKSTGYKDKLVGSIKETVGSVTSDQTKAEGIAQKEKGQAEIDAAKAQNRVDATKTHLQGTMEKATGALTGNDSKRAQGHAHTAEANVKKENNKF